MAEFSLSRGDAFVGAQNFVEEDPTLPSEATGVEAQVADLIRRTSDLEIIAQSTVQKGEVLSEIAIGSELIKIQSDKVAVLGETTFFDWFRDINGQATGVIDPSMTIIRGGVIQTEAIISSNWGAAAGTQLDLDNGTFTLGGSSDPKLYFDGTDLTVKGTIAAGSFESIGWGAAEGIQIDLDNETITAGGSSSPKLYYDGAGNLSVTGAISGSSTINGTSASTVVTNASNGNSIQQKLEVTGSTILAGTITPENAGGIKVGSITWNSTTGALTGGSGIAITEYGIIGADSGSATFTIEASSGSSTWAGDIDTSGSVTADGSTSGGGSLYAILAAPTSSSVGGIRGESSGAVAAGSFSNSSSGSAVHGYKGSSSSGLGAAVWGQSDDAGNPASHFVNLGGGTAINMASPNISGDVTFEDDVDIDLTLTVTGTATFNSDVTIQGNSQLTIDRQLKIGTDEISGDSSLVIGTLMAASGVNTIIINEGTAPIAASNRIGIYAHNDGTYGSTLGLIDEGGTLTTTGSFSISKALAFRHNGSLYFVPLSAVL